MIRSAVSRFASWLTSSKPITQGYREQSADYGGWWNASVQQIPPFSLWYAEQMTYDGQVGFGLNVGNAPLVHAEVKITGDSTIAKFVRAQWDRIWKQSRFIMKAKQVGWAGFEQMFKYCGGMVEFHCLKDFHQRDVVPLLDQGRFAGVRVRNVRGNSLQDMRDLPGMKGLWITFRAEHGKRWGRSLLRQAYPHWLEKNGTQGAVQLRRLRMLKDAWIGDQIHYPHDLPDPVLPNGVQKSWRDMAREAVENRASGGILALPYRVSDQKELIKYTPPQSVPGATEVFGWSDLCDKDILIALDVHPEVVQAADTGSGFSGRMIPFISFLTCRDEEFRDYVTQIDEQTIKPLVWVNFGREAAEQGYKIEAVPIIESMGKLMGAMGRPDVNEPHSQSGQPSPGQQPPNQPPPQNIPPRPSQENSDEGSPSNRAQAAQFALDETEAAQDRAAEEGRATVTRGEKKRDAVANQALLVTSPRLADMRRDIGAILTSSKASETWEELLARIDGVLADATNGVADVLSDATFGAFHVGAFDFLKDTTVAEVPVVTPARQGGGGGGSSLPPSPGELGGSGGDQPRKVRLSTIDSAVDWLESRQSFSREDFDKLNVNEKANAFTITGDLSTKSIDQIRGVIAESVADGTSRQKVIARIREELPNLPLSESHLEMVYRNAVNEAYSRGSEAGLRSHPIVEEAFPYRLFVPIHDSRARPEHRAMEHLGLNGTAVYFYRDPTWLKYRPPFDWNCRCGFVAITKEKAAELGVIEAQEWIRTGIEPDHKWVTPPPFEPSPGFVRMEAVAL